MPTITTPKEKRGYNTREAIPGKKKGYHIRRAPRSPLRRDRGVALAIVYNQMKGGK